MLSDSPPERDLEWTAQGMEGAWRYVQRLWRMVTNPAVALAEPGSEPAEIADEALLELRRTIHRTIAGVTEDLEVFRFNRAVARVRELTNALGDMRSDDAQAGAVLREGLESAARLIAPMTPHLAEQMWRALGHDIRLAKTRWPEADESLVKEQALTLAVQVNGKLRGTVTLAPDADAAAAEAAALAEPNVRRAIGDKAIRKVIVVPEKVINVVV